MNEQEAGLYIRGYFDDLFGKHDPDALDRYLDRDYFDDDIGDPTVDHILNSKEYLQALFKNQPTIGVEVNNTAIFDNVISAHLDWYVLENGERRSLHKGVAIFILKGDRILRRHTFIYENGAEKGNS